MRTLIALALSDLHAHVWDSSKRTDTNTLFFKKFMSIMHRYNVPVIFGGDFFHSPDGLSQELMDLTIPFVKGIPVDWYSIYGNHDINKLSKLDKVVPNYIDNLSKINPKIKNISFKEVSWSGIKIFGIPYIDHNLGLGDRIKKLSKEKGKKILVIHTNLYGAKDTNGLLPGRVENVEGIEKYLDRFDLVLCGHIHKYQKLFKNTHIIGSPFHTRITDIGCDMGYLEIYDDFSVKFVNLNLPEYKWGGEDVKDPYHYYVALKDSLDKGEFNDQYFNNPPEKLVEDRLLLATRYLDYKGVKDKDKRQALIDVLKLD